MAIHRFYENYPDCNRCEPGNKCPGASHMMFMKHCTRYIPPKDTWMVAELALAHPTSLNEALSQLPFEVNLGFYLK